MRTRVRRPSRHSLKMSSASSSSAASSAASASVSAMDYLKRPMVRWSYEEVVAWLEATSVAAALIAFMGKDKSNRLNGAELAHCVDDTVLKEAGVDLALHRAKLLFAIKRASATVIRSATKKKIEKLEATSSSAAAAAAAKTEDRQASAVKAAAAEQVAKAAKERRKAKRGHDDEDDDGGGGGDGECKRKGRGTCVAADAEEEHVLRLAREAADADPLNPGSTTVLVRTLTGKEDKIKIDLDDSVAVLKRRAERGTDIPADQQILIFGGERLRDYKSVRSYSIIENSLIHLVLSLRGS